MNMKKLMSCEFNIDTACVELRYADGWADSTLLASPIFRNVNQFVP